MDVAWLATEAKRIHDIFLGSFYMMVSTFLVISICLEYFKLPMGGSLSFAPLIGRVFIAFLLLSTFTEFQDTVASLIDGLTSQITDITKVNTILNELSKKLHEFSWHNAWPLAKDSLIAIISFVSVACMYYSVFFCNGILLFTWTILYVLSPLLIAFFIFPQTSQVTRSLYSSIIQVSLWKVMWAILITLLWSTAFGQINKPGFQISFPSVIVFNLIMASAIFRTPQIVAMLSGPGLSAFMGSLQGVQVGPVSVNPSSAIKVGALAAVGGAAGLAKSGGMGAGTYAGGKFTALKTHAFKHVDRVYTGNSYKPGQQDNHGFPENE